MCMAIRIGDAVQASFRRLGEASGEPPWYSRWLPDLLAKWIGKKRVLLSFGGFLLAFSSHAIGFDPWKDAGATWAKRIGDVV